MTEKKALANESEDVSKTRIKQLSVESTEENSATKKDDVVQSYLRQKREEHDRKFLDDLSRKDNRSIRKKNDELSSQWILGQTCKR